jgi:hypothetical protein
MYSLNKLDFGLDSAESEMQYLKKIFLSLPFYERLKETKKWLILGRKGSGKTAACLMFFEQIQHTNHVSLLTPKSLSVAKASILEKTSLNPDEAALRKWVYLFLLEASRYIIQAATESYGSNFVSWPETLRKVRIFLANNDENEATGLDKALNIIRSINKFAVSVLKVEGSIELGKRIGDVAIEDLGVTQNLIEQSFQFLHERKLYFLFDKVDDLWDSSIEGQKLIVGLLRAAKEINDRFDFIKVIIFLRTDIYSYLRFHDSDKYRSQTEFISWDVENLKKLIALRIRKSTNMKTDLDGFWDGFFPYQIDNKSSFEFMVQYTLMRPRDLIQLCNKCRDEALARNGTQILPIDIFKAIGDYSIWKLEDLVSEYSVQYPFFEKILLSIFYANPSYELGREKIELLLNMNKAELVKQYGAKYFEPLDVLLQILYTVGFLGVVYKESVLFEFLGDKVVLPYANLFQVHKAFRKGLRIPDPYIDMLAKRDSSIDEHGVGAITQNRSGSAVIIHGGINISGGIADEITTNAPQPRIKKTNKDSD